MEFLFKTTVWERVKVSEDQENRLLDALKNGEIGSSHEIYEELLDCEDVEIETILDSSEQMTLEENNGQSTIEVHDEDNLKPIWQNGK